MAAINVKRKSDDNVRRVDGGVRAEEEPFSKKLIVYDASDRVIAKFDLGSVEDWWPEDTAADMPQNRIEAAVHAVEEALKPDVIRIRYSIARDWSDEPAVYFRVVLSDDAAAERLHQTANKVRERLERLDLLSRGFRTYHNFRSESEQAALREEAWA